MGGGGLIVDPGREVNSHDSISISQPEVAASAMLCFGEVSGEISHEHLKFRNVKLELKKKTLVPW